MQKKINELLAAGERGYVGTVGLDDWKDLEIASEYHKRSTPADVRSNLVFKDIVWEGSEVVSGSVYLMTDARADAMMPREQDWDFPNMITKYA